MRRIAIAVVSTVSGLVLLFSYHTSTGQGCTSGARDTADGPSGNGSTGDDPAGNGPAASSGPDSSGPDSSGPDSSGPDPSGTTVTGESVGTRWGPVQVQITVRGGRIVAADAVAYPNHNHHDTEINSYAVPILNQQAVQAQSSRIDGVSGATGTSTAYRQSLQSAIDEAHLD